MKLTYEALLNDPSLLERIDRQARRERAEAMRRFVVETIKRVFADRARPYLARQG